MPQKLKVAKNILQKFFIDKYDIFPKFADREKQDAFYKRVEAEYMKENSGAMKQKQEAASKKRKEAYKVTKKIKQYESIVKTARNQEKIAKEVRERNKAFFDKIKEGDQDYLMSVKVVLNVKYKNKEKAYQQKYEVNRIVKKRDATKQRAKEIAEEVALELVEESGIVYAVPTSYETTLTKINKNPKKMSKLKMKDGSALLLDGDDKQDWDRKLGTCVHDYIIHRYGAIKGFKSVCTYEGLDNIFRDYDELDDKYTHASTLEVGVSTEQIELFCKKMGLPMYALDQDNFYFHVYTPEKRNHNAPSLMFKVMNNHFYPIGEEKKKSLLKAISNSLSKSDVVRSSKAAEEKAKEKTYDAYHVHEEVVDPFQVMIKALSETGVQPADTNIYFDGDIKSFEINKELHLINQSVDSVKKVYEKLGMKYNGQNVNMALFEIIDKVAKVKVPKSTPNPHVYETLVQENVKARTHYGCVNGYTQNQIEELVKSGGAVCCDIAKCYSKCMYDPFDNWMLIDYNDNWEAYAGDHTKFGLYYVETNDYTMLHGNNIYTNTILAKAAEEGIRFKPTQQLLASKSAPNTLFQPILDAIKEVAGEDKELMKSLNNMLSGYLGKHYKNHYKVAMNSCMDSMWNWFIKNNLIESKDIFVKHLELEDQKRMFFYGHKFATVMSEINIPMYIQIKDYANMRLYDMVKAMGGELAFRKTDCAVTIGGSYPELSDEWGGYRESELPKMMGEPKARDAKFVVSKPWTVHDVHDSSEWEALLKIAQEQGGILIQGRAGTGKSYAAQQIAKALKGKVSKIAFTNKAALNIKGKTIHKFLKMDKDGNISGDLLLKIRDNIDFIIVDEISMIPKDIWRRLVELKRYTGVKFILVGDYRQCPPVENEKINNYFDHPAVKYLANDNKVDLTVRHRYDERLWDLLENVNGIDIKKFGKLITKRNICFYNKTRKYVNKILMNRHKTADAVLLREDKNDEYTQDVWLYKGLPVIARTTVDGGDTTVNNEYFTVSRVYKEKVVCTNMRPGENDEPEEHTVEVKLDEFHKLFVVNYCSTTHKAQGETITEDFTIWDWDRMDERLKYTAMSRAKKPEQINFMDRTEVDACVPKSTVAKKIASHKSADVKKGLVTDIDAEHISELMDKQNRMCYHCHEDLKVECYDANDAKQFSIDRVDDTIGHVKGNVVLSCWACNRKHMNKKL
jgi:hypothetical protein